MKIPVNSKMCGTCNFWAGVRKDEESGTISRVSTPYEMGKCLSPDGPLKGKDIVVDKKCDKWLMWEALNIIPGLRSKKT